MGGRLALRLPCPPGRAPPDTPHPQVPAERAKLLTEGLDSLAAYGLADLDYVITLGHSVGHISLVHAPSRTMLAGDALSFVQPSLRLANATADEGDPRVRRQAARARTVGACVAGQTCSGLRCCPVLPWPQSPWLGLLTCCCWAPLPLAFLLPKQVALAIKPWSQLPGLTLRAEPHIVAPSPRCPLPLLGPPLPGCPSASVNTSRTLLGVCAGLTVAMKGGNMLMHAWEMVFSASCPATRAPPTAPLCLPGPPACPAARAATGRRPPHRPACWPLPLSLTGCWHRTTGRWPEPAAGAGRQ